HELGRGERTIVGNSAQARVEHPGELNSRDAIQLIPFMTRQVRLETRDGRTAMLRLRPAFVTDNIYAAHAAIRQGGGYGILPYSLGNAQLRAGTLIELCPVWKPPPISLYVPTRKPLPACAVAEIHRIFSERAITNRFDSEPMIAIGPSHQHQPGSVLFLAPI